MAVLRPHLALTVSDVQRAVTFYSALFDIPPEKTRPGYAKFSVPAPALNLTLVQGERTSLGAFNHGGIQMGTTADVVETRGGRDDRPSNSRSLSPPVPPRGSAWWPEGSPRSTS